ncbi:hypothetical protein LTR62_000553 [Meristemomyces frigidus]|uniref:Uncharacterized protein n=1 Tax=Meristemomyces frigidus TaxID=1508187 RepID=A0AAN7TA96_9PEZI|nr:hypothetical protein LTR62_000553 [Meristemomyces frigidus]
MSPYFHQRYSPTSRVPIDPRPSHSGGSVRPPLSHALPAGPSENVHHDLGGEQQDELDGHTTLLADLDTIVESPAATEEPGNGDLVNGLVGGAGYATTGGSIVSNSSLPSWNRRPVGSGSYSSYRSWRHGSADRSRNPALEAVEGLRTATFPGLVSLAVGDWTEGSFGKYVLGPKAQPLILLSRFAHDDILENQLTCASLPSQDNISAEMAEEEDEVQMDSSLPVDDGMGSLREKMHEIRHLAVSTEEKARLMHYLMMQDYASHKAQHVWSNESEESHMHIDAGSALPHDPRNPYNLLASDLELSFSPLTVAPLEVDDDRDASITEVRTLKTLIFPIAMIYHHCLAANTTSAMSKCSASTVNAGSPAATATTTPRIYRFRIS